MQTRLTVELVPSRCWLVAPCPACHQVKHAGLASKRGRLGRQRERLVKVDGWSEGGAALYLESVFKQWAVCSRYQVDARHPGASEA